MPKAIKDSDGSFSIRVNYTTEYGEYKQKFKKGFKTESKAYTWAETYKDAAIKSDAVNKEVRLKDLIEYVKGIKISQNRAPQTIEDFLYYTGIVVEHLGNVLIERISTPQLQAIVNLYSKQLAKCHHICAYTSSIFKIAYQQEMLQNNPFSRVIKPPRAKPNVKPCSDVLLKKLLKIAKEQRPQFYAPILLMSACGLRPSEAIVIKESSIDKTNWTLTVNSSCSVVNKTEYIKNPKSAAGIREIPITETLYNELTYFKRNQKKPIESEWICCDIKGKHISYSSIHSGLFRIEREFNLPHFFPYQFRHYFGNTNKKNKIDSYTTSVLMGHSSPDITKKHYYSDDKELNKEATNLIISGLLQN
jgi:integrase